MTRYDKRVRALAVCLSTLAGYVDAVGFIELGGFFVSFMSGNSTRLGVGVGERATDAMLAGSLIALFLVGVIAGALVGHVARGRRRSAVLLFVAALLALAALGAGLGFPFALLLLTVAMGAENSVFERDGEVSIGLTYMTGALVRLGHNLVQAFLGKDGRAWVPYLFLWAGLTSGAVAGALTYPRFGLACLWAAAGMTAILAVVAEAIGASEPVGSLGRAT